MDEEQIRKILEDNYEDSKEDTVLSIMKQLYGKRMHSSLIIHAVYCSFFFALAIVCSILFFKTDQLQFQIMYAALFVCCIQFVTHMKTVYWQTLHRNGTKREIKRLELRIAELNETVKNK